MMNSVDRERIENTHNNAEQREELATDECDTINRNGFKPIFIKIPTNMQETHTQATK